MKLGLIALGSLEPTLFCSSDFIMFEKNGSKIKFLLKVLYVWDIYVSSIKLVKGGNFAKLMVSGSLELRISSPKF